MSDRQSRQSSFYGGVAILMVGIAIVKIIGAFYKIILGNVLSDEGFGHFNNAYVIYNMLQMVSTAGLPVALSKTIAEANALGWTNQVKKTFRVALTTFVVLGVLTFAVMFAFAEPLCKIQGDSLAALAVRAMAPTCFFVCIISAFRGYAQGHANMTPTSVSQIIEALGKLLIGIALAWYFMKSAAGSEVVAAGAIFGVTAGAAIALVYLVFDYLRRERSERAAPSRDRADSSGQILRRLLIIAIPITISASIVPVTTWIDTYQVQNILQDVHGLTESAAVAAYGAYQKSITIYNLPNNLMVALTAAIIPAISACWAKRDRRGVGKIAESSLRTGAIVVFPAGVGLLTLASPIIHLIFYSTDHSVADPTMMALGVASSAVCLTLLCNAILQASGMVTVPVVIMALGCLAKVLVNNFLVRQEAIGIVGAPVGTTVCYTLICIAELVMIKRLLAREISYKRVFIKPAIASLIMGAATWAVSGMMQKLLIGMPRFQTLLEGATEPMLSHFAYLIVCLVAIGVAVIIYAVLIVVLGAITKEDLSLMPKGDKIAKILRIRD